ncbi:hypothetical protein, partial [Enterobacter asburiae]
MVREYSPFDYSWAGTQKFNPLATPALQVKLPASRSAKVLRGLGGEADYVGKGVHVNDLNVNQILEFPRDGNVSQNALHNHEQGQSGKKPAANVS